MRLPTIAALLLAGAGLASAQATGTIDEGPFPEDLNGSNFTYPHPVKLFRFSSQLRDLEMAFMDVPPSPASAPNGRTAVLLHGKNFCGATWEETIRVLSGSGFRVVAPDQVGFCKSSKPAGYQFSLSQLAWNTRGLLATLGVDAASTTVMGHSMGGMLAARYGMQYRDGARELVMVNAIGMEDYVGEGVPYIGLEESAASEAASTYDSIRAYEQEMYYVGEWRDEYDVWVNMLLGVYYGSQRDAFVDAQARVVDMVLTQPVANSFGLIEVPTLLMVGEKDKTAIGSQWSPPDVQARLGHFDVLGPQVQDALQDGHLVTFPNLGHAPHISQPDEFHQQLLAWLNRS
ncbi:hypothetical protein N3K66_002462 [Trichothecium roseum]|uniref:Uncharacterized protein n=1 Tax=Trichothecium roseum TaxID=47278 RepID=A0ACC0VBM6_9HYPO|nr:hypothetical protein N3K66_002462 [Trichothecium roseum]